MKREWTRDEVRAVRQERFEGATLTELADRYRSRRCHIARIVHGEIHVHYGGPIFGVGVGNRRPGRKGAQ